MKIFKWILTFIPPREGRGGGGYLNLSLLFMKNVSIIWNDTEKIFEMNGILWKIKQR
jgi:hypothetical protein